MGAEISQIMNRFTADKEIGARRSSVTTPRAALAGQAASPATGLAPGVTPVFPMRQLLLVGNGPEEDRSEMKVVYSV